MLVRYLLKVRSSALGTPASRVCCYGSEGWGEYEEIDFAGSHCVIAGRIGSALEGAIVMGGLSIRRGLCSIGIPKNSIVEYETALKSDAPRGGYCALRGTRAIRRER